MPIERNRQVQVERFGTPCEVAKLALGSGRAPAEGEVLVRTAFAPINPADINVFEGSYGSLPELPAVVGNEGAGTVVEVGRGVDALAVGDQVIYLGRRDCWQDFVLAKVGELLRVPAELDLRQASMLKINPLTAHCLLQSGDGEPGEGHWIAQNAANSGVGRAVIALAREAGLRSVNFVRRQELVAPLLGAGADVVVTDDEAGLAGAREAIGGAPVRLALNAVGGDSALRLMSLLAEGGSHVTYGAMGRRPLKVPNSFLIFRDLHIRGFWLSKWLDSQSSEEIAKAYGGLAELMLAGKLPQPVDSLFPPEQIREALEHAQTGGRDGKVLLDFGAARGEGDSGA